MILKRCPSCRTLCDTEVDVRCFACGGELAKSGPVAPVRVPEVLRTSRRDQKSSSALLGILAVFGVIGVLFIFLNATVDLPYRFALGALLLAALVFGVLSLTGNAAVRTVSRSLLKLFAFFGILVVGGTALVVGLLILLFAACATGIWKIG